MTPSALAYDARLSADVDAFMADRDFTAPASCPAAETDAKYARLDARRAEAHNQRLKAILLNVPAVHEATARVAEEEARVKGAQDALWNAKERLTEMQRFYLSTALDNAVRVAGLARRALNEARERALSAPLAA